LLVTDPLSFVIGIAVADWNGHGRPDLIVSRMDHRQTPKGLVPEHHKVWLYLRRGHYTHFFVALASSNAHTRHAIFFAPLVHFRLRARFCRSFSLPSM
jgi:hypothetical protein